MNLLLIIILILAAAVAIPLIAAPLIKKEHRVKREITIDVPVNVAFDFPRMLKNQEKFKKWAKDEGDRNW